ncbi:outer membrane protein [Kordiimonas sp. SCSIO 12610]|uniref:outer membrane protein n=1 Tax=Kordiimonas sp. SCSIO 12610 TaxID=2829597 RepID=UPI00210B578E|nr:outer membrane beta-barrel protein [Kordiimonas sp. SCSIO 12610]UTW56600.1 outer membrane beta-barrel protein [Kordiimonas sp. SCSIO 12610]
MRKALLIILASLTLNNSNIHAQDEIENRRFEGLYGGIEGGFDRTELFGAEDNTFYYGLNLGYRLHSSRDWVFGIEGSFGDTNFNTRSRALFSPSGSPLLNTEFQWSAALTIGKVFGDNNLIFAKVGTAGRQIERSATSLINGATGETFELPANTSHQQGYLLGLGYERAISKRISLKLSLDYLDFNFSSQQFQPKVGVNFKF